jgi:RNA polymerase sigma-70 factor (ECF subfamily)
MVADDMVALMPQMHNFARSLCRDAVRAADLVQEALLRALTNVERFQPGTNLKAWLFTILRNEHYSQMRRQKFEAVGMDTTTLPEPSVLPDHDGEIELRELNSALSTLPTGQRTALLLVSASGLSYEEAANICGCAVGTIKSRVARAREMLEELLDNSAAPARRSKATRTRQTRQPSAARASSAAPSTRHVFHSSFNSAPSFR